MPLAQRSYTKQSREEQEVDDKERENKSILASQ